ncbi:hypothetical protein I7I53_07998 [Histoplasma capsulatum var. duboisii H88]|nr:hypothetical protein I7I53_07998 [Histoplasma capsulatum var. duboisii H88]
MRSQSCLMLMKIRVARGVSALLSPPIEPDYDLFLSFSCKDDFVDFVSCWRSIETSGSVGDPAVPGEMR